MIIWMHTWESGHLGRIGEVGRFGVPFFTIAAFYLLMRSFQRRPGRRFGGYLRGRFLRLYMPFIAWGSLGFLLMVVKHRFVSHTPIDPIEPSLLLNGASFQLWYLPFLFLAGLPAFPICRAAAKLSGRPALILAVAIFAAGAAVAVTPRLAIAPAKSPSFQYSLFFSFSQDAIPGVLWGIATALALGRALPTPAAGWCGLVLAVVGTAFVAWGGRRDTSIETVAGLGLLLFALSMPGAAPAWWSRYAFLAYGMYLSQNVVLEPTQTLLGRLHVPPTAITELTVFAFVVVVTAAVSIVLQRWKFTRWTVG